MEELLLSDDELELIWTLPYITETERLRAIARAQLEKVVQSGLGKEDEFVPCYQLRLATQANN